MLTQEDHDLIGPPQVTSFVTPRQDGPDMMVGGAYEGAQRFDETLALWQPSLTSADFDILNDKPLLDARVRDSIRNDSYVFAGSEIHKDNIVGSHYLLNCHPNLEVLGLDSTWAEEFQREVESKFQVWADSPSHWIDKTMAHDFTSMVRMAAGLMVSGSEILASSEWMSDGRPFGTAIQMIDTDRLSNPYGQWDNPNLRGGVEKNNDGVPIGYHIRKAHPVDFSSIASIDAYTWQRVPAREPWGRPKVIHIVDRWRVDQSRGVSTMVSALKEMRMTKRYRDVVLQNAVVNATYAATIESDLPSETVMTQLGGGNVSEVAFEKMITQYAQGYLAAVGAYAKGAKNIAIDGVKIPHLFPGTKLQLRPAGGSDAMGTNFEASLLRYLSANLGVSYEQLSRDYSHVNYASFRAGAVETWKGMQSKKRRGTDAFANQIYRLWFEEAVNAGQITSLTRKCPSIYDANGRLGLFFDAYTQAEWIGASRGQVDELKETQAAIQRIIFGISSYQREAARLGMDWRKLFAQIQREREMMDKLGILQNVSSDMMNATTGTLGQQDSGQSASGFQGGKAKGKSNG